jgi:hypothetical protein
MSVAITTIKRVLKAALSTQLSLPDILKPADDSAAF